jgi:hypothetical protein
MTRTANLRWMILCVVALTTAVASAQQKGSDLLKFSASIYAEDTDNRDSLPAADSNFDVYIKPRMDVHLVGEHGSTLDFHYAPYYRYRSNPSTIQNQTELFHDLALSVQHLPDPATTLIFSEYFYRTEDPSIDTTGVMLRRDCSYMMNHIEVSGNRELSDRVSSLNLSGRSIIKRYDDSIVASESDEDNKGVCLTGWHELQRTLAVLGVVDVAEFNYDSSLGIERGFDALSAGSGMEKIVSKNLKYNVRVGLIAVNYKDASVSSKSQPFVSLDFKAQSTPSARMDAAVSYLTRDSDVYPFSSQECSQFFTRMEWDSTSELTLGLEGTYRVGKYSGDSLNPEGAAYQTASGLALSGNENTILLSGDLTYKIGLSTSIKIAHSYENVNTSVRLGYTRNATSVLLTQQF